MQQVASNRKLPESDCFENLLDLVREGKIPEETINEAVRRVLRAKIWLGLLDEPFVDPEYAEKICDCEEHRKLALEAARQGIVLLKNDGLLPRYRVEDDGSSGNSFLTNATSSFANSSSLLLFISSGILPVISSLPEILNFIFFSASSSALRIFRLISGSSTHPARKPFFIQKNVFAS